jgi:hypothetical protein
MTETYRRNRAAFSVSFPSPRQAIIDGLARNYSPGASEVASVPEVDTGAFVCAAIASTSREVTSNTTKKTKVSASRMA